MREIVLNTRWTPPDSVDVNVVRIAQVQVQAANVGQHGLEVEVLGKRLLMDKNDRRRAIESGDLPSLQQSVLVVICIQGNGEAPLPQVGFAPCPSGLFLRPGQSREQHGRQDGNDGNDDQKFDERKPKRSPRTNMARLSIEPSFHGTAINAAKLSGVLRCGNYDSRREGRARAKSAPGKVEDPTPTEQFVSVMAEAYDWYEERKAGLGHEFLAEVRSVLQQLQENPLRHAEIYRNSRRALIRRFPYKVFYIFQGRRVEIIGVIHAKRHPQFWQRRTP